MTAKGLSFPALSPMSMDYKADVGYEAEVYVNKSAGKITVNHVLTGDSIIGEFIKAKKATFGCVVALPATMYRRTHVCKDIVSEENMLTASQEIDYKESGYSDSVERPQFLPIIIKQGEDNIDSSEKDIGLGDLWRNEKIKFPAGGIIGSASWWRVQGVTKDMVFFRVDEKMEPGRIKVEFDPNGGGRFLGVVDKSFLKFLKNPTNESSRHHVRSVCIHVFSQGLGNLASGKMSDWESYPNLKSLAELLAARNYPSWSDNEFQPESIASDITPYEFDIVGDDGGDEDE